MKYPVKRAVALTLATIMAMTPLASASEALGSELRKQNAAVAPGVTVTGQSLWSATYSDLRTEHYIDYVPGTEIYPVVTYGTYVSSTATLKAQASALEQQGLHVVAGINAGFYETKNGTPVGIVITDGLLQSANPNYYSIGFKADGTAVMGIPTTWITASWLIEEPLVAPEDEILDDIAQVPVVDEAVPETTIVQKSITISGFNKIRQDGGYYLYSDTYGATTKNNVTGVDVLLRPVDVVDNETGSVTTPAGLPVNGSVVCEVVGLRDSKTDNSIPSGCFVLSMNSNSSEDALSVLNAMQIGDQITLTSQSTPEWADVVTAVSGLYSLVENGQVADGLSSSINPYTAVGVRADGSVVLYTIDGRQSGYSIGATYKQVAQRMIELGCITAIAMDGGGSTSIGANYPDLEDFHMINRGSDGSGRAVSTCLFLVTQAEATGILDHFYVTPQQDVVLQGSSTEFNIFAVDSNYYPIAWNAELDDELIWESTLGDVTTMEDGTILYTAIQKGSDTITVTGNNAEGTAELVVIDQLSSLSIVEENSGNTLTSLTLKPGQTAELAVKAIWRNLDVACADDDFVWMIDNNVGTVDETGRLTAGKRNAVGKLTVSGGGLTASVTITVDGGNPFADTVGHWAEDSISDLYLLGITTGETNADGSRSFFPNRGVTRGEMLTFLIRMLGEDVTVYESIELPFADRDAIASWLVPYVKTAYALGLIQGDWNGSALYAKVDQPVTREAAMVMIGRTLNGTLEHDLSTFADSTQVSSWATEYVQTLVALGIINGSDDGLLHPTNGVLRGEMAKIIIATLDLPEELPDQPGEEIPDSDQSEIEQPDLNQPNTENPNEDQPGENQPEVGQPDSNQPNTENPNEDQPGDDIPNPLPGVEQLPHKDPSEIESNSESTDYTGVIPLF